jgi:uncharacterized protein (DUF427 family)
MGLQPVSRRVRISLNGVPLAESRGATRLMEVGRRMYDPIIYVPRADVAAELAPSPRQSHCPLKGDCSWYSVDGTAGRDIAWSYEDPFPFADGIKALVAFDPARVTVEEAPL